MKLLPLLVFWCLWFLNFFTRASFSPILPLIEDSLIVRLTSPEERSMGIGAIISSGVIFGMGGAPLLLGIVADHFSFQVGILWMGILTVLSSGMVKCLKDA